MIDDSDFIFAQSLREKNVFADVTLTRSVPFWGDFPYGLYGYGQAAWKSESHTATNKTKGRVPIIKMEI